MPTTDLSSKGIRRDGEIVINVAEMSTTWPGEEPLKPTVSFVDLDRLADLERQVQQIGPLAKRLAVLEADLRARDVEIGQLVARIEALEKTARQAGLPVGGC